MTKQEFNKEVATAVKPVSSVQSVVEATMDSIKSTMVAGDNIYLRGFGTFARVTRAPKLVRDIQRNKAIQLGERVVPVFKPAKEFKDKFR